MSSKTFLFDYCSALSHQEYDKLFIRKSTSTNKSQILLEKKSLKISSANTKRVQYGRMHYEKNRRVQSEEWNMKKSQHK